MFLFFPFKPAHSWPAPLVCYRRSAGLEGKDQVLSNAGSAIHFSILKRLTDEDLILVAVESQFPARIHITIRSSTGWKLDPDSQPYGLSFDVET